MASSTCKEKSDAARIHHSGEYQAKPYRGKTSVWQLFSEIVDGTKQAYQDFASCKTCGALFTYKHGSAGTSSLLRRTSGCSKSAGFSEMSS